MYSIALQMKFQARHFLIGGDWGTENQLHAHEYRVEWVLEGPELDGHGYLLDLVAVEARLEAEVSYVRGQILNDLAPFRGLNPSVERLARHLSNRLVAERGAWDPNRRLAASHLKVWENESAWAAWTQPLEKK